MQLTYLFIPKNHNLRHCSDAYNLALESRNSGSHVESIQIERHRAFFRFFKKIINLQTEDTGEIFLFAPQGEYLFFSLILKISSYFLAKKITIYYLMHEPRYEQGRTSSIKAKLLYMYHLLMGRVADLILLPSNEALLKAQTFIAPSKLHRVNLAFRSISDQILQSNLTQLKSTWESKTFSLLGTAAPDKNPQGFVLLASIVNQQYPGKAQFIRAGRDRDVNVDYDKEIVRFPGYMPDRAKNYLFGLTHFIVVPYLFSTQSGVVAEALSHGKLIIVNDIPAFAHLKGLDFVFAIDFNDEDAIVKCLKDLFNLDWTEYQKRYWNAVNYFRDNFSEIYLAKVMDDIMSNDKIT